MPSRRQEVQETMNPSASIELSALGAKRALVLSARLEKSGTLGKLSQCEFPHCGRKIDVVVIFSGQFDKGKALEVAECGPVSFAWW
jgi:hypothetical protein